MLARQIRRLRPGLLLLQHPNDLLFREPRSLHLSVLHQGRTLNPLEENLSGRSPHIIEWPPVINAIPVFQVGYGYECRLADLIAVRLKAERTSWPATRIASAEKSRIAHRA